MRVLTDGKTQRNKFFERLCLMSQRKLKRYLCKELKNRGRKVQTGDGYLYSEGSIPIILTAHMDTVHNELPMEIVYMDGTISSPQGIGGDDRCGIYMILKIIKDYDCHVLFFEDEESGGKGSIKFNTTDLCKSLIGKINYAIELDRCHSNDAVYYDCDNYEFEKFIEKDFWKHSYGSFSDIGHICPKLKCAGVNLSCGYYNAHFKTEYVVLDEMENAISEVKALIERTDMEKDVYEYIEMVYDYKKWRTMNNLNFDYNSYLNDKYDYDDDYYGYYSKYSTYQTKKAEPKEFEYSIGWVEKEGEFEITVIAANITEAVGSFLMDYPYLTYADILYAINEETQEDELKQ